MTIEIETMSETTFGDEDPDAAIAQHLHEPSSMDEGLIEQLVRGTSWATQTELTDSEYGEV